MKNVGELIQLACDFLKKHEIDRPKREAEDLIAHVLKMKRIDLYLDLDRPLQEQELVQLRGVLKRRAAKEPFAYIVGQLHFAEVVVTLGPEVLIPRPETEILVEKIASSLKEQNLDNKVLWDLCTGSGCIAIALKKRFPNLIVIGSDLSPLSIERAQKNALMNNVDIEFRQGDLFAPFKGQKCDFFICNPPYLSESDLASLDKEVAKEPLIALDGGKTGLLFYEKIAKSLRDHLQTQGLAWFEIGSNQGENVKKIFDFEGWEERGRIGHDWAGHERFFFLE